VLYTFDPPGDVSIYGITSDGVNLYLNVWGATLELWAKRGVIIKDMGAFPIPATIRARSIDFDDENIWVVSDGQLRIYCITRTTPPVMVDNFAVPAGSTGCAGIYVDRAYGEEHEVQGAFWYTDESLNLVYLLARE